MADPREEGLIYLDGLIEKLRGRAEAVNSFWLKAIGKRIRELKNLDPSDAAGIDAIRNDTQLVADIMDMLQKTGEDTIEDARNVLRAAARLSMEASPVAQDLAMEEWINGIAEATAGQLSNMANTSAVGVWTPSGFQTPKEAYIAAIDQAAAQMASGTMGLNAAVRSVLKQFADSGLAVVQYESGTTRSLGAAVEMNIREATSMVYQGVQERIGQEYGADGYEISAHGDCAPDHLDIQGKQFSKKSFEKLQNSLARPIGKLNCRHTIYAIILGISPATYSDEELEEMRKKSLAVQEYDGKQMTTYEATQVQRRLEREIRKQKNRTIIAKEAEDDVMRREAQMKINQLTGKYKDLSDKFGLKTKAERMQVSGYRPVKVENRLSSIKKPASKISSNIGIIKGGELERSRLLPGSDTRAIVSDAIGTKSYAEKIRKLGESDKVSNIMTHQARTTLWRRNGTPYEDLIYIDPKKEEWKAQRLQDIIGGVSPTEEMKKMVMNNPHSIIAIHNHPHNMLPSFNDLKNAKHYNYGVILCHNGTILKYVVSDEADINKADYLLTFMQKDFDDGNDLTGYISSLDKLGVHLEIL